MNTRFAVAVALVLLLSLLMIPPAASQQSGQIIRVHITNLQGQPIAAARMRLRRDGQSVVLAEGISDRQGYAQLQIEVPPGNYLLSIEARGYLPFESGTLSVALGQQSELEIRMLDEAAGRRQDAVKAYNDGTSLYTNGNLVGARQKFQEAISLDPSLSEPHVALAATNQYLHNQAIAAYNAGAVLLNDHGNIAGARQKFQEALSLDPGLLAAQRALDQVNELLRQSP